VKISGFECVSDFAIQPRMRKPKAEMDSGIDAQLCPLKAIPSLSVEQSRTAQSIASQSSPSPASRFPMHLHR
jgi:hypothetical protein